MPSEFARSVSPLRACRSWGTQGGVGVGGREAGRGHGRLPLISCRMMKKRVKSSYFRLLMVEFKKCLCGFISVREGEA